jgi:hypothetical protein
MGEGVCQGVALLKPREVYWKATGDRAVELHTVIFVLCIRIRIELASCRGYWHTLRRQGE